MLPHQWSLWIMVVDCMFIREWIMLAQRESWLSSLIFTTVCILLWILMIETNKCITEGCRVREDGVNQCMQDRKEQNLEGRKSVCRSDWSSSVDVQCSEKFFGNFSEDSKFFSREFSDLQVSDHTDKQKAEKECEGRRIQGGRKRLDSLSDHIRTLQRNVLLHCHQSWWPWWGCVQDD